MWGQLIMGQHLASFREFFRMNAHKHQQQQQQQNSHLQNIGGDNNHMCFKHHNSTSTVEQNMTYDMLSQNKYNNNNISNVENNENQQDTNITFDNNENKDIQIVDDDNEEINNPLDNNHNSRFESIYSQQIDAQDVKQVCNNNSNFVTNTTDTEMIKQQQQQQEPCCSASSGDGNSSSTSTNSSGSSGGSGGSSSSSSVAGCGDGGSSGSSGSTGGRGGVDGGSSSSNSSSEDNTVNPTFKRTSKTLSFVKRKTKQRNKEQNPVCNHIVSSKKKRTNWVLKFNCAKNKSSKNTDIPDHTNNNTECVCTGYKRTEEHPMGAGVVFKNNNKSEPASPILGPLPPSPVIDLSRFNPAEFPMEDCDERARQQRAKEMEEGVEPPPGYRPTLSVNTNGITVDSLAALFQAHAGIQAAALTALSQIDFNLVPNIERPAHTQVDYVHCLVPDLRSITACSFYWGKMDRYEAERLLDGKEEGTFLLRDSAQEEFLFSVSFRKYNRSLHARIEQWNHKFSFDSHDPGVYASDTVCGLIEHYKDPSCCMFFEPMLTKPLHRNFAFPLQHLCRAVITTRTTYDGINKLQLPKTLKSYLKEYHYKQRVRVRRLDGENDVI
ncbi:hypothetical protein HCN44_008450 [Aphidius gifuensis]|uniref:Suppressor of cytokine signaling 5 n=1 Tax=Aphidius gifuensis TaxID=684658 RepID=A0A834XS28_APHGI|nr:suppressor of cytokine signaling 5 [Aphidius gifuensis]XP_044016710.1 suppressor of cytokine signaling 5 [Aphidius gifuensis]XP_044016711.1 suppressor of cytokine signaling 5 [Aphidius gifuensis]KAF7989776.1 hypothetical protein HCN44_008450 [Aphidius gifuensis]